ncbi:hypothetical protein BX666DRAFT_1317293 [Dichotomocladium elegans]|nr:hypothetical protein BX666DRAFT_1317293 [Dichotomocladium elegans]
MTAFSVSSLLNQATAAVATHYNSATSSNPIASGNEKTRAERPAVLDISSLLNGDEKEKTPSLSPARTPSPVSASSAYPPPPLPTLPSIADTWPAMLSRPASFSAPAPCLPLPKPFVAVEPDHHQPNNRNTIWMHDSMASSVSSLASTSSSCSDASKSTCVTKLPLKKQQPPRSLYDSSSEVSDHEHDPISLDDGPNLPLKAKRRRANAKQLEVLNRVFERTVFPSTQLRAELGRQLGMSPRTVQIWFQNRRQAIRTRERQRLLRIVRDESSPDASSD